MQSNILAFSPAPNGRLVRGSVLANHLAWILQYHGAGGRARIALSLPADVELALRGLLKSEWYPLSWLTRLQLALDLTLGATPWELGRYCAHVDVERSSRAILARELSDTIRFAVLLHSHRFSFGRVTSVVSSDRIEVAFADEHQPERSLCDFMAGYYQQLVSESGGREQSVFEWCREVHGGESCLFVIASPEVGASTAERPRGGFPRVAAAD